MPTPPDNQDKYSFVRRRLWILLPFSVLGFGCLAASQFWLAISTPWIWLFLPLFLFTVVYYGVSLAVNLFSSDFDLVAHKRIVASWQPTVYPSVDVFLPVCGESLVVVKNTWTHVALMAHAYRGMVTPYVLDDGGDHAVAALAAELGFGYHSRSNRGWFKKAGNLRFGFRRSFAPYILVLDADFAPRPDLLEELLPYLDGDAGVAIVQSPQFFRVLDQQNWIERGAGAVQEFFYRAIQMSRQGKGGAICVGTCAVYRRAALEENGGATLIEHSEDVHTGFDLRRRGWTLQYVPLLLATGLCPNTTEAFVAQQYRWCSGSLSLLGSGKFWTTKLRVGTRLCYLSGLFYYIHTALFTFVGPLVPITLLVFLPWTLRLENMTLVLPSVIYATLVFPLWHRSPYRLEAWAVRMMYGWAHMFAIWDRLRGRPLAWRATGSSATRESDRTRRFWIGITVWGGTTALVWVGAALWRMSTSVASDYALVLAAGLFYTLTIGRVLLQPPTGWLR